MNYLLSSDVKIILLTVIAGDLSPATNFKVTFAPLPTFGSHHKIYNKYKLYLKTNKF